MSVLGIAAALAALAQSPIKDPRPVIEPRPVTNPRPGSAAAALRSRPAPIVITDKPYRAGNLGATVTDRMRQREERSQYLQQQLKQRSQQPSARLGGMARYRSKNGGPDMLTNRIQKYDALPQYKRIKIEWDPIVRDRHWGVTIGKYTDSDIHKYVDHFAGRYALDPSLIHAMIRVESKGNPYAVSRKGAAGLMQLMPGTAADLKVGNAFDPAENIGGGTQYISKLLALFNGNYDLALAGYNAGPETVRQYGGIPPIRETQDYVDSVLYYWSYFKANGNSFAYKKFDAELTPTAMAARRKARLETRELGDASRPTHEVQLAGGIVQHADEVRHQGDFLYLVADGRTFRLSKELVLAVDGVALDSGSRLSPSDLAAVPDATVPLPRDESVQLAAQI
jgi:soluble lytic murein transglycosylase-like protein